MSKIASDYHFWSWKFYFAYIPSTYWMSCAFKPGQHFFFDFISVVSWYVTLKPKNRNIDFCADSISIFCQNSGSSSFKKVIFEGEIFSNKSVY